MRHVLVEFGKPDCGHCQALLQELELVQAEVKDLLFIYKMNVQENFLIPGELEIHSLQTLALYVDGQFATFIGGIGKKRELLQQLMKWMASPHETLLEWLHSRILCSFLAHHPQRPQRYKNRNRLSLSKVSLLPFFMLPSRILTPLSIFSFKTITNIALSERSFYNFT